MPLQKSLCCELFQTVSKCVLIFRKADKRRISPNKCLFVFVNTEEGRWCETVSDGGFSYYKDMTDADQVNTV